MRIPSPLLALLVGSCILAPWGWGQKVPSAVHGLYDAINRDRKARGLPSLHWDEALAIAARQHALLMAEQRSVSHQFSGEPNLPTRARKAGARYSWLAENVDQGLDFASIHQHFMRSLLHHANILDKDMDSVGIGVAERKGQLFVVEDFSKAR